MIISYKKISDDYTTYTLQEPDAQQSTAICTELCTIDGITYVSVPEGIILPEQPVQIADSVQNVTLTSDLRDRIKIASPHVALISQRMIDTIRNMYSIDDEMYFARIGVGASLGIYTPESKEMKELAQFGSFVEGVRQWGRDERAKLGL